MLRLYPDAEATMGDGKVVGETGPDVAGKNLSPTTVKVCALCKFYLYVISYSSRDEIRNQCLPRAIFLTTNLDFHR